MVATLGSGFPNYFFETRDNVDIRDEGSSSFQDLCSESPDNLRKKLTECPSLVTQKDDSGQTLLHHLAKRGNGGELVQVARQMGASILSRDRSGNTPLHLAIKTESKAVYQSTVPALLQDTSRDELVELLAADTHGDTLLHLAARYHNAYVDVTRQHPFNRNRSVVPELLEKIQSDLSEEVDRPNNDTWTPMDIALSTFNRHALWALVQAGVRMVTRTPQHIDEIIQKAKDRDASFLNEQEKREISHTLKMASTSDRRISAFHQILKRTRVGEAREFVIGLLRQAISNLSDEEIDQANEKDGYTFLHLAAYCGDAKSVQALLSRRAKVNVSNQNRISPILLAVMNGHTEAYLLLKANGALVIFPINETAELQMIHCNTSAVIALDLLNQNWPLSGTETTYRSRCEDWQSDPDVTLLEAAFRRGHLGWILALLYRGVRIEQLFTKIDRAA